MLLRQTRTYTHIVRGQQPERKHRVKLLFGIFMWKAAERPCHLLWQLRPIPAPRPMATQSNYATRWSGIDFSFFPACDSRSVHKLYRCANTNSTHIAMREFIDDVAHDSIAESKPEIQSMDETYELVNWTPSARPVVILIRNICFHTHLFFTLFSVDVTSK